MTDLDESIDRGERVFKIKYYLIKIIFVNIFTLWIAAFAIFSITHGGGLFLGVVLSLVAIILVPSGLGMVNRFSEIVIDDQGVSRRIFGRTLQAVRWEDVKIIKKFRIVSAGFYSRVVDSYSIYPLVKPTGVFVVTGSIGFSEGFENMEQLIGLLNYYICKHDIKVEIPSNGTRIIVAKL